MARKQKVSNGLSDKASDVVLVLITGIVLFLVAYPLYYVLIASFSNPYDVYAGKTFLFFSIGIFALAAVHQDGSQIDADHLGGAFKAGVDDVEQRFPVGRLRQEPGIVTPQRC